MEWFQLFRDLGVFVIASVSLQKIIGLFFDKRVEKYKSELSRIAIEHQTKFVTLHSERLDVIKKLHLEIINNHDLMREFWNKQSENKYDEAYRSVDALKKEFEKNRYYFDTTFCEAFDNMMNKYHSAFMSYSRSESISEAYSSRSQRPKEWGELRERVNSIIEVEIPNLKKDLEDQFRKLLGVVEAYKKEGQ